MRDGDLRSFRPKPHSPKVTTNARPHRPGGGATPRRPATPRPNRPRRGGPRHATARIIALLEAILSGRCAATLLRSVSTDAGFRQFSRTRHQMADSTDGPVLLRMSSMNRVGDDRLDIMVALSTSGLLAVTVHRVAEGWRLTGCTLLRSPRQPGRGRADDR